MNTANEEGNQMAAGDQMVVTEKILQHGYTGTHEVDDIVQA